MNAKKYILVVLMAVASIIAQLLNPISARADGETTPPPVETIEATEPPAPTDEPIKVVATESPVSADAPTAEPVITDIPSITVEPTEVPIEISNPESVTPIAVESTDEPTLLEVVQEFSDETSVVVLDENGQAVPLATEDAADIIESGDPMWCPDGVTPIANTGGCTGSYLTMESLLNNESLYINSYDFIANNSTGGTIWISSGTIGDVNPITIDGNFYTNWANYSITLQGGWGGSNSVFAVPISIVNWNANVAVNNITIDNSAGGGTSGGLYVNTFNPNATVDIDRVTVRGARGFGLLVEANGGAVTVQNSTFRDTVSDYSVYYPYGDGADIFSNGGNVTIRNSRFINNEQYGGYGAWISAGSTGDLIVDNSDFIDNSVGLSAFSSRDIYIYSDNVFQDNFNGLTYSDCSGNLFLETGVTFTGNYYDVQNWGGGCSDPIPYVAPASAGFGLITQSSGKFKLDCSVQGGFSVPLPNGDLVQIFCPVTGEAEIARLDNTILPKTLPDGYTYASAFELKIIQSDEPILAINDAGYIKASFIASALNNSGNTYSILYWDPKELDWVVLKDYMRDGNSARSFYLDPEDPTNLDARRKIISGVQLVSTRKDDRVEVSTNFPGIFVLAQH